MFCSKCGKEVRDGAAFCPNCGQKMGGPAGSSEANRPHEERAVNPGVPQMTPPYYPVNPSLENSEEYKPISMWGYFGYEILFAIPVVGFVLLIVFSLTSRNKNLKNFARSYFCFAILLLALFLILLVAGVFGGAFGAAASSAWTF